MAGQQSSHKPHLSNTRTWRLILLIWGPKTLTPLLPSAQCLNDSHRITTKRYNIILQNNLKIKICIYFDLMYGDLHDLWIHLF